MAVLAIAAGLGAIVAATAWIRLAPPSGRWSASQQAAYEEAERRYGAAISTSEQEQPAGELKQATERYAEMRDERQAALGGRVWLSMLLQMFGFGLSLIGAVRLILLQNEAEDRRAHRG